MKNNKYIILLVSIFALQSCFVAKDYQRPNDIVNEQYFRTDNIQQDSLSIANLSWKDVFTDQKLSQYIDQALVNNLDVRIALQNIEVANAYLKQGKAAYFPTLNANASYSYSTPSLNSMSGQAMTERDYFDQYDLSASLSWEADIWGKRSEERRVGKEVILEM